MFDARGPPGVLQPALPADVRHGGGRRAARHHAGRSAREAPQPGHLDARPAANTSPNCARALGQGREHSPSRSKVPATASSRSTTGRCRTAAGCRATRTSPSGARPNAQAHRPEAPARHRAQQHVAGSVHVRRRRPGRAVQSALRRDDGASRRNSCRTARSPQLMAAPQGTRTSSSAIRKNSRASVLRGDERRPRRLPRPSSAATAACIRWSGSRCRAGGWVTTLEDITERRIAQERLREQKLQLDAALSNMSQGLCMFNAEGRVALFNPRYAQIVGLSAESLRGTCRSSNCSRAARQPATSQAIPNNTAPR